MSIIDTLLKKAIFFEKMALYHDRKTFLRSIAQNAPVSHPGDIEEVYGKQPDYTTKEFTVVSYPPINPNVQKMLNVLLQGKITPLNLDGELGPLTRGALQKFHEQYGQPSTPEAVAQFYKQNAIV